MMISSRKHRYKISPKEIVQGMQLKVKSKDWYQQNKNSIGMVTTKYVGDLDFLHGMSKFCGQFLTVKRVDPYTTFVEVYETSYVFSLDHFEDIDRL